MTKTLETKKKILNLLKKRQMTITGLSEELGLSTATVSQHLDELQRMGAVEKIDNEHFKKLKYYKATEQASPMVIKYVLGALAIVIIASALLLYHGSPPATSPPATAVTSPVAALTSINATNANATNTTSPIAPGGGAYACPLVYYHINGSVLNYSGMSLYYLNYSDGKIADYVIARGGSGSMAVQENISNVLEEPANSSITQRQHYVGAIKQGNTSLSYSTPGLNISISPENYTLAKAEIVNFTLSLTANSTAPSSTYLIRIDGPCAGGVTPFLVTVGTMPYNGTVSEGSGVYA